jgi:hypothetical protein
MVVLGREQIYPTLAPVLSSASLIKGTGIPSYAPQALACSIHLFQPIHWFWIPYYVRET